MKWVRDKQKDDYIAISNSEHCACFATVKESYSGVSWIARVEVRTERAIFTAEQQVELPSYQMAQIWATAACLQLQRIAERLGEVEQ